MGILYYPWQYFTSIAPPYWEEFAQTVSANFHVAWIMCCTVVVWFMEGIWERYPFTMIKTPWLRRLAVFFGIIVISWALCFFFWYMQEFPADQVTWRVWNGGQWGYDEAKSLIFSIQNWTPDAKIIRSAWENAWTLSACVTPYWLIWES